MPNVWGYWECPSCKSIMRGDKRNCTGCGAPIPNNVKYIPPDDPRVADRPIESVSASDESFDANWTCEYCGYQNRADVSECEGCGSPRFMANKDYFGKSLSHSKEDTEQRKVVGVAEDTSEDTEDTNDSIQEPFSFLKRNKKAVGIAAGIVMLLLFLIWLFVPVTRYSTVEGFAWERTIPIEEYTECHESAWSLPPGAVLERTSSEIHHYDQVVDYYETKTRQVSEQVLDGYDTSYRDLGNGQFETVSKPRYRTEYHTETYQEPVYKSVPVFKTKYYYEIGRWKHVEDIPTSASDHEPVWGESDLPSSVYAPAYGDRRQAAGTEKYFVFLKDRKGNVQKGHRDYDEWISLKIGDEIEYKSFRFSDKPL